MNRRASMHIIVVAVVATVFFAGGFYTSTLLNEHRVREQSAERFKEFLTIGIDLGFVTVDRGKLDELECIATEAQWEDDDAAERAKGCKHWRGEPRGTYMPSLPVLTGRG